MSVSGEGAALRSARTWLLLLRPEIPDRRGGKGAERLRLVVKAAGCLGGSQRRHGMAYGAAGKQQHGVAGAYTRRNTQGRVEGAFSYPNWRLFCTGSCSAGSTRPDVGLPTPSIAAFGRRRPWIAAFGRRLRSRDRDRRNADPPYRMDVNPSSERQQAPPSHAPPVPSDDNTASNRAFSSKARFSGVSDFSALVV